VFRIRDRITSQSTGVRAIIVGVDYRREGEPNLLLDWEVLIRLNELPVRKVAMAKPSEPAQDRDAVRRQADTAERFVRDQMTRIEHPFQRPEVELVGMLCPQ
jgi:hypothetical protein